MAENHRTKRGKLAILFALLVCGPAQAGFFTGNDLNSLCQGGGQNFVTLYVAGVIDKAEQDVVLTNSEITALEALQHADKLASIGVLTQSIQGFCLSKEIIPSQAADVVCNYLRDHHETRQKPASFLVNDALVKAWPCS